MNASEELLPVGGRSRLLKYRILLTVLMVAMGLVVTVENWYQTTSEQD